MNQTTTIFEPGGPRQRRLVRIATIGSAIILLALAYVVIEQLHYEGQLISQKWLTFYDPHFVGFLLKGFSVTLKVCAASVVLSCLLGIVLAVARLSPSKWASVPATVFVEFFRGMPFLLIIFVVMFGLPPLGITMPPYWQLVLSIVLVAGSMFAEVFRAGILDIPAGQTEAGLANGLTHRQAFVSIVLPQAVRNLAPALLSQTVRVIKESSLGYVVGVAEVLNSARVTGEFTGNFIQAYLAAGVLFIVVNSTISYMGNRLASSR